MRGNRSRKRILVRRAACQDKNRDNCIFHGKYRKRSIDLFDMRNLRLVSICELSYPTRLRIFASRNKRIIEMFDDELSASFVGVGNFARVITRS